MADAPRRIQLSRAKGWRLPPNSVKVDRSTKFGNPYRVGSPDPRHAGAPFDADTSVERFTERLVRGQLKFTEANVRTKLRGLHLACWCRLCPQHRDGKPFKVTCLECATCHADTLGWIANELVCEPVEAR